MANIKITTDSGDVDIVAPLGVAEWLLVAPTKYYQNCAWTSACGIEFKVQGERRVVWQVPDVSRPLAAICRILDLDNRSMMTKVKGEVDQGHRPRYSISPRARLICLRSLGTEDMAEEFYSNGC